MTRGPAVLATRSAGKLRELRPLFAAAGIAVVDLVEAGIVETSDEDGLEVFSTFEENALAKARYFHAKTGRPTFADDSGLEVAALGGAPGVMSKRWSGRTDLVGQALDDENNRLLLERLEALESEAPQACEPFEPSERRERREHGTDRRARYVCAAAFTDGSRAFVRRGEVDGCILRAARGVGGFGYDPFFLSDELGETFGEASREEKERVSHRGRAFRAVLSVVSSRAADSFE